MKVNLEKRSLERRAEIEDDINKRMTEKVPDEKWSGSFPIPSLCRMVNVKINGIGRSEVLGYWLEYGWVGLVVRPENPPDWYVAQNGRYGKCIVFGAEVEDTEQFKRTVVIE